MSDTITQQDKEFLNNYDSSIYEKPSITVDLLVFTIEDEELKIVMIKRKSSPYKGMLSLPGAFVGMEETLDEAASRGIKEKTGLVDIYFEQLYTWGEVKRDPRMRIISVSYMALVSIEDLYRAAGSSEISNHLYTVDKLLQSEEHIAFDHKEMIAYGRERIKNKVEYTQLAFEFLPDKFTLPQLQKINEILLGKELYKANFRKKVKDMVIETEEFISGGAHRPSKLYVRKINTDNIEN
ncbi:NUDIX hydrolase [Anaerosporobacter sp.]